MTYTMDICRAKRLDNKELVYGYYAKHKEIEICPIIFNGETDNDKKPKYKHLIIFDGMADFGMEKPLLSVEIDPATKCRCTGLTDTNGEMIFERDIIKDRNERVLFVKYEDCRFKITDEYDNGVETTQEAIDWFEFKIIGNTIDNKNLLGGK